MLDFARTDAECEGAKCAMCGSMRVSTHDGGTWEGKALLRANYMDDALSLVAETEICKAEVLDILF